MEIDRQCGIRTYKGKQVTIFCEIVTCPPNIGPGIVVNYS